MSTLISYATILTYDFSKSEIYSWHCVPGGECKLLSQLFEYFYLVKATAYEETDVVRWRINNEWYSTDQIERMIKLKPFL